MGALTGLFGGLAGLLSMIGIYGVMAYHVRRQQHEIGVKMALGANGGRIQKTVIKHGLGLSLLGVTIGSFGVWMGSNLLKTLLQDVKPSDPAVLCGTVLLVLFVAVLASSLPARRAARIDPMTVIRSE